MAAYRHAHPIAYLYMPELVARIQYWMQSPNAPSPFAESLMMYSGPTYPSQRISQLVLIPRNFSHFHQGIQVLAVSSHWCLPTEVTIYSLEHSSI